MPEYHNPILPGFNPDPSICRCGNDYYLTTSSFSYFPMLPVYHSRDMVNWTLVNHAISREEQNFRVWEGGRYGIFAPTIRYHKNLRRYFIIAAFCDPPNPAQRTFIISAESPEKEWSPLLFLEATDNLDPSLFFDDDGKTYIQYVPDSQDGIYQYQIDIGSGRALSRPKLIWRGTGGRFPEGPHIFRFGDYYYLLATEGGIQLGHASCIARSRHIDGDYESCPANPILIHRNRQTQRHPIQCVGHADFMEDASGKWWTVFLAFRPSRQTRALPLGRETFLAPLEWDGHGWPVVRSPGCPDGTVDLIMTVDRDIPPQCRQSTWHDDFDSGKLGREWYFTGFPGEAFHDVASSPGQLKITGLETFMEPTRCSPLVCRPQTHFEFDLTAKMLFEPVEEGDEAGITVFNDEERHYEIGIKMARGKKIVFVRRSVADMICETPVTEHDGSLIYLGICGDSERYGFRYGDDPKALRTAATGSAMLLSHRENWKGNMLGFYCRSRMKTPAYFSRIEYSGIR